VNASSRPRAIVGTDLDGTLLDHDSYDFRPALPALQELKRLEIPVVLVSSKTRAEIEALQRAIAIEGPIVAENGARGSGIDELRGVLGEASRVCGVPVRNFGRMSIDEVAVATGLPPQTAVVAAQREFDEPFEIIGGDAAALLGELARRGYRTTRGGRFHHVFRDGSKAEAFAALAGGYDLRIALGDSQNDEDFLDAADIAILIPGGNLAPKPHYRVAPHPGPRGWNEMIFRVLSESGLL
jgi:mannosyl-3-phosphoglycerate phosphatase